MSPAGTSYQHLFTPCTIGTLRVKNRIAMAPIDSIYRTVEGDLNERHRYYLGARAAGGAGLIFTDNFVVEYPRGAVGSKAARLDQDRFVASLNETVEEVHAWDAVVFAQISHAGRQTTLGGSQAQQLISASAIAWEGSGTVPRALTVAEIDEYVSRYVEAAVRARRAACDGVEVHACHGYLLSSFLSPALNRRADSYGGSPANRARIVVRIVKGIKERLGGDYPLSVRLNVRDGIPNGIEPPEAAELARIFQEAGADVINTSAGTYESGSLIFPPTMAPQGNLLADIQVVKQAVDIPVIAVSRIKTPELAERVIAEGQADFVSLGRALLADPEWPNKVQQGKEAEILPCIGCNYGCIERIDQDLDVRCNVNPYLGREKLLATRTVAARKRSVLVVGAGPAGLSFALMAKEKGHDVQVLEAAPRVGGQLVFCQTPEFKRELGWLLAYYEKQVETRGLEVGLGTRVSAELVEELDPEVLVLATGARPHVPFESDGAEFITYEDVFSGEVELREPVTVVGGGSTGSEVAVHLAQRGHRVTLVEESSTLAARETHSFQEYFHEQLERHQVDVRTGTRVVGVERGRVRAVTVTDGSATELPEGELVMATGVVSERSLADQLAGRANVHLLGDCFQVATILEATDRALFLAERIL